MGCFGFICNKCGFAIRGGEKTVFKHIRHGEVLGEATGICDNYGRIEGNDVYRSNKSDENNINSHAEIIKSEFYLLDSKGYKGRIYKGKPVVWMEFRAIKVEEGVPDLSEEMYKEWESLPKIIVDKPRSGTEAFHKACYDKASEELKAAHVISEWDPNQSLGNPRKKFC